MNYNTEIILNPNFQSSDFDISTIDFIIDIEIISGLQGVQGPKGDDKIFFVVDLVSITTAPVWVDGEKWYNPVNKKIYENVYLGSEEASDLTDPELGKGYQFNNLLYKWNGADLVLLGTLQVGDGTTITGTGTAEDPFVAVLPDGSRWEDNGLTQIIPKDSKHIPASIIDDLPESGLIDTISVNGIDIPAVNKNVDITVPTKISDLENDSNLLETISSTDNHIVVDNTDPANPTLSFQLVDNENLLTDDELAKLAAIEAGAQVNVIEEVTVDNVALAITNKSVNIDLSGKQDALGFDPLPISLAEVTNWFTGFEKSYNGVTVPDSTISFNTTTKIFTIAPTGTNFNVYSRGTKFIKTTETINLTSIWANNTLFFIYFSETGVLSAGITPWQITGSGIPIATVVWNGTASFSILADERHSVKRNNVTHENLHKTRGAQIALPDTDFSISTMSSTSTIIQAGTLIDEDIELPVAIQTDSLRIVYRVGSTLTYADTLSATSAHIIAGALQYDNAGTLTPVTDGYFIRNTIIVSNSASAPIVCRVAQSQFANVNDARNSEPPAAVSYLSNETRQIYSVIWKNVGGTPTFVEFADFRKAPTLPNGFVAKTPRYLDGLEDVFATSPNIDEVLKWNGSNWVSGTGVVASSSAGIEFFPDDTTIVAAGTNSTYPIKTLSKSPITTAEDVDTITLTTANVVYMYGGYLYDTPIGRTVLDAGVWGFDIYCGVDNATGTSVLRQNMYRVRPSINNCTTTGTGTTRTLTSSGTPFILNDNIHIGTIETISLAGAGSGYAVGNILTIVQAGAALGTVQVLTIGGGGSVATIGLLTKGSGYSVANTNATTGGSGANCTVNVLTINALDSVSLISTPQGLYQIASRVSDSVVTITVPTTYVNETNIAYSVYKKLFGVTTPDINNISGTAPTWTGLTQYTISSVQSAFTVEETDKLATNYFGTSTSNGRSIQFSHNGTTRYSHVMTPLITLHNNLAGVQELINNVAKHINDTTQTFTGVKTFSSSPIVPTATANDNSTKVASTAYVDSAPKELTLKIQSDITILTTGDGKYIFTVPEKLDGFSITSIHAALTTASTVDNPSFQVHNLRLAQDILSTNVTIDATEFTSYTALTPHVVNTSYRLVAKGDRLRCDVDNAGSTATAKGWSLIITFTKI